MNDTPISQLPDGGKVQTGDAIPVARSGANYKVVVGLLAALGAGAGLGVSGTNLILDTTQANTWSAVQTFNSGDLVAADPVFNGGAISLPPGTTSQRPASPVNGMIRYNSTTASFEAYANTVWGPIGSSQGGNVGAGVTGNVPYYAANGTAVSAATLGNDLAIVNAILNTTQPADRLVTTSTDTITSNDCGGLVKYNRSSSIAVGIAAASSSGLTQGCSFIVNNIGSGAATITPTGSTINGQASLAIPSNTGCSIRSDSSNYQIDYSQCTAVAGSGSGTINPGTSGQIAYYASTGSAVSGNSLINTSNLSLLNAAQSRTAGLSLAQSTPALATSTFTPDLNAANHFDFPLVHASCPCTIANPANIASRLGSDGILEIDQSGAGSDAVSWGSAYKFAGGTAPTLTTTASHQDYFSYYVKDANNVIVNTKALNISPTGTGTLSLDGSGSATGTTSPPALSLTTTKTNDVIILLIQLTNSSGTGGFPSVSSISDTGGLTWHSRKVVNFTASSGNLVDLEEWYAVATNILSSDPISLTLGGGSISAGRNSGFAINGANTTTPFDTNGSVPASTSATTGSTPSVTISTTKAVDLLFNYIGDGSGSASLGTVTRPSGYTQIVTTGTFSDLSSAATSSALSSAAQSFSFSGGSNGYYTILDAVQASGQ